MGQRINNFMLKRLNNMLGPVISELLFSFYLMYYQFEEDKASCNIDDFTKFIDEFKFYLSTVKSYKSDNLVETFSMFDKYLNNTDLTKEVI